MEASEEPRTSVTDGAEEEDGEDEGEVTLLEGSEDRLSSSVQGGDGVRTAGIVGRRSG